MGHWFIPLSMIPFDPFNYAAYRLPKVLMLSVVLTAVFFFWLFKRHEEEIKIDIPTIILFVFTYWAFLRFTGCSSYLKNQFMFPLIFLIFMIKKDMSKPLMITTALIGAYGVLQFIGIDIPLYKNPNAYWTNWKPDMRPFSFMGNPNFLGETMAALLPLTIAKFIWLAPVCAFLVIASASRAAMIGMVVGLVFYFLKQRGMDKRATIFILVTVLVAGVLSPWAIQRLSNSQTIKMRILWWNVTGKMIAENPLMGVGADRFREEYASYQARYFESNPNSKLKPFVKMAWAPPANATLEAPHNQFLQIAAEYGIPALLLFLVFLFFVFKHAPPAYGAGVIALMTAGFFGFPLQNPETAILFGCLTAPAVGKTIWKMDHRPIVAAFLIVSCIYSVHFFKMNYSANQLYRATATMRVDDLKSSAEYFRASSKYLMGDDYFWFEAGRFHAMAGYMDKAYWAFQKAQGGCDCPHLYNALGHTSGLVDFYNSKKLYYFPGVD